MKLNLGCADRHMDGFVNVDIAPPADQIVDLVGPWPWPDSSVDEVLALDICEHISDRIGNGLSCPDCNDTGITTLDPTGTPMWARTGTAIECRCTYKRHPLGRIHFMNELHRVLKPGARATIETPNASRGCGYFQDPTHVSPWCLSTFRYFEHGAFAHTRLAKSYGITAAFKAISMEECKTPGEFWTRGLPRIADAPIGVWIPPGPEFAWKIRAVLEAVK